MDYKQKVAAFVKNNILGKEKEFDALPELPHPCYLAFHKEGLANWWVNKSYGGLGLSLEESVDIVSELAYGDAGVAFGLFISILSSQMITLFGNDEQKNIVNSIVSNGGFLSCLGSEKEAGSELLRTSTTAELSEGHYVLNGEKYFSTNSGFADYLIVVAACPQDEIGYKAFLIPKGTPGITIVRRWNMIGVRGSGTYQVSIKNCIIPLSAALEGHGLRTLEVGLNFSRVLIAACGIGIARRMQDLAISYSQTKQIKNLSLFENPVFASKMGQIEMQIDAMISVCKSAARELDSICNSPEARAYFSRVGTIKASVEAKLFCSQVGWEIANICSQMFGGLGYTDDLLIGKLTRDMRFISIVEGGEDVCRELIYSRFVKPRFLS